MSLSFQYFPLFCVVLVHVLNVEYVSGSHSFANDGNGHNCRLQSPDQIVRTADKVRIFQTEIESMWAGFPPCPVAKVWNPVRDHILWSQRNADREGLNLEFHPYATADGFGLTEGLDAPPLNTYDSFNDFVRNIAIIGINGCGGVNAVNAVEAVELAFTDEQGYLMFDPNKRVKIINWNEHSNGYILDCIKTASPLVNLDPALKEIHAWVEGLDVPPSFLLVVGHSLGAWAALKASVSSKFNPDLILSLDPVFSGTKDDKPKSSEISLNPDNSFACVANFYQTQGWFMPDWANCIDACGGPFDELFSGSLLGPVKLIVDATDYIFSGEEFGSGTEHWISNAYVKQARYGDLRPKRCSCPGYDASIPIDHSSIATDEGVLTVLQLIAKAAITKSAYFNYKIKEAIKMYPRLEEHKRLQVCSYAALIDDANADLINTGLVHIFWKGLFEAGSVVGKGLTEVVEFVEPVSSGIHSIYKDSGAKKVMTTAWRTVESWF